MTLACEDAYSKLAEVVTVADVSDEDRVGNNLWQISKLRLGQKTKLSFLCATCDMNSTLGSVVPLAMFIQ